MKTYKHRIADELLKRKLLGKGAVLFLMVLIGVGQYAYRRPDGVFVVPIGCLKD